MTRIKIVLDSSADLTALPGADFASAPLTVSTAERRFVDDEGLDVSQMVEFLAGYNGRSTTSCPNTEDWLAAFGDAERIFCITITSNLSGSYNSARIAKEEYERRHPERRVALIDSLSTGPEIALMAERILSLAEAGESFEAISERLAEYKTELIFVLQSMRNLANNGRISKLKAGIASFVGIRAIGRASEEGTLEMLSKCLGEQKALAAVLGYMGQMGYRGGRASIAHCMNPEAAEALKDMILGEHPSADVSLRECRGLCSFYAERGGLLIGFERAE